MNRQFDYKAFGSDLYKMRTILNLTQPNLSKLIGVPMSTLWRIENHLGAAKIENIYFCAKFMDKKIEDYIK